MKKNNTVTEPFNVEEMEQNTDIYVAFGIEQIEVAKAKCKDPLIKVEHRVNFSRWVPDGFGTADLVIIAGGEIHVCDLKYGKGILVESERNPQLMLYALGLLDEFDCLYDIETVKMSICQPRLENISTWTITAKELYEWAETELKPKAELAFAGEGEFEAGNHCVFCAAKYTCRERARSNLDLAKLDFKEAPLLSDDEIVEVLTKSSEVAKWAADIYDYATAQAIVYGKEWPGFKVVEGRSNRKYTDETKVIEAAKAAGYPDIFKQSLLGIGDLEKKMGKAVFNEVIGAYITKPPGKPTLVAETDKRTKLSRQTAETDFMED